MNNRVVSTAHQQEKHLAEIYVTFFLFIPPNVAASSPKRKKGTSAPESPEKASPSAPMFPALRARTPTLFRRCAAVDVCRSDGVFAHSATTPRQQHRQASNEDKVRCRSAQVVTMRLNRKRMHAAQSALRKALCISPMFLDDKSCSSHDTARSKDRQRSPELIGLPAVSPRGSLSLFDSSSLVERGGPPR